MQFARSFLFLAFRGENLIIFRFYIYTNFSLCFLSLHISLFLYTSMYFVLYLSNFCLPVPLPSLSLPRYSPISRLEFPSLSLSLFSIKSPHHRRLLPCFTNSRTSRVPLRAVCFVRQREILKMRCSKADSISPLGYFSSISHF